MVSCVRLSEPESVEAVSIHGTKQTLNITDMIQSLPYLSMVFIVREFYAPAALAIVWRP